MTEPLDRATGPDAWLYRPRFPAEWEPHALYDLATWTNGMAFRSIQFSPTGRPILKIAELKNGITGQTAFSDAQYEDPYLVSAGDLLFAWSGQPETSIDAFIWRGPEGWLNQHIFRIEAKEGFLEQGFLYYLLKYLKPHFVAIARNKQTTGLGHVTTRDLKRIEVRVPPAGTRSAITAILSVLDDKIELNRRMNETLEAMAQAIFRSWFVDFVPVRAKAEGRQPASMDAATAALFPDAFEESPLGAIPRGWHAGTLGEVAGNLRRATTPADVPSGTPYIGLEHMPRKSIALGEWGQVDGVTSGKFQFRCGELLFGKLRPYFHKVGVAPVDGVCSTDILVISPRSTEWFGFVLGHVSSEALVEHANAASTGTKMPRTNWRDLAAFGVAIPTERLAAAFTLVVRPLVDLIISNVHQSHTLAAIRDTLLPKLISGEVRVRGSAALAREGVASA